EPPNRRYVCLQSRRIKRVTKTGLSKSVSDFLKGDWAPVSRKFIYATSDLDIGTALADEVELLTKRLARKSIEFELWDATRLSDKLRPMPEVVDAFFGRTWVRQFLGEDAVTRLRTRLDAHQVANLRKGLGELYRALFRATDS